MNATCECSDAEEVVAIVILEMQRNGDDIKITVKDNAAPFLK